MHKSGAAVAAASGAAAAAASPAVNSVLGSLKVVDTVDIYDLRTKAGSSLAALCFARRNVP